ncbi:hypothetical protein [Mesorhizobium prunaredense]|uniref:hypothetical protein n=1 Tax=Mesorhizobium prunaredense TaxID=1631249 RepID=UPI00118085CE|nr:hypothetical protein [Mesorhizobium prunaredense]
MVIDPRPAERHQAEKARQPEAAAGRLISEGDPLDRVPGLDAFVAPTLHQLQQCWRIGIELLERLALEARDQPFRLAHFGDGDDRVILLKSGKGPARLKRLRHGTLYSDRG